MNEQEYQRKQKEAADLGRERGQAAGSWVFDGNSSEETIRRVLKGIEDGDPEIMDMQPAPLSGEWADEPTIGDILRDLEVDEEDDAASDILDAFEQGFSEGYWDEIETSGRGFLGEGENR